MIVIIVIVAYLELDDGDDMMLYAINKDIIGVLVSHLQRTAYPDYYSDNCKPLEQSEG